MSGLLRPSNFHRLIIIFFLNMYIKVRVNAAEVLLMLVRRGAEGGALSLHGGAFALLLPHKEELVRLVRRCLDEPSQGPDVAAPAAHAARLLAMWP